MARILQFVKDHGRAAPVDADGWFARGCELEARSAAAAVEAYRRALELEPRHAPALVNAGRLAHAAGELGLAEALFRWAAEVAPAEALAAFDLGVALEDLGRDEEARACYERALASDPAFADAHWNLARLEERRGERARALRHWLAYRRAAAAPAGWRAGA
jgi:tetratricopeptide (TPR) repeat protein